MLRAEDLGKITNVTEITEFIHNQLSMIDERLLMAKKSVGRCAAQVPLPVVFPINCCEYDNLRYIVYKQIIASLEERGFTIKIKNQEPPIMYIFWNSQLTIDDIEKCRDFVNARIIS